MIFYLLEFPHELGIDLCGVKILERPRFVASPDLIPYMAVNNFQNRGRWAPIIIAWPEIVYPNNPKDSVFVRWINDSIEFHTSTLGRFGGGATFHKKNIVLKQIDVTGNVLEEWVLVGCSIFGLKKIHENSSRRRVLIEECGHESYTDAIELNFDRAILR